MQRNLLSKHFFDRAKKVIPGGVNSPVRACKSVGADPIFVESGSGCWVWDVDGNSYMDFVCSWGPLILGHCHPEVVAAVKKAAETGSSFGIPTWSEVKLAEMIVDMVPSIEKVRLVNSGTEATMSAVRLARGFTNRKKIVKFNGCYHGHADSFLVKAGSGVATLGIPGSPGVPEEIVQNTIAIPFNDKDAVKNVLDKEGDQVACIIVEPVPANMGVVLPDEDFLPFLRQITQERGIVLIFDEVITGFRLAPGGAQEYFDIMPDLTCLGKIIGGGLPVGAYGGKAEIMDQIAPDGPVYQAGTLSGNPLAMAAGIKTLEILSRPGIYELLENRMDYLAGELKTISQKYGIKCTIQKIASMMTCFFGQDGPIRNFEQASQSDTEFYGKYFRQMLRNGVYLAPSQFEAAFVSLAHNWDDLDFAIEATESSFKVLA
ncbi:MAG: glutamate-1-semialdehyde 2,1-aminomutase [Thermodesulfobacteria bacterium]|nr:glutamate-1-semialdehyde 2,1-aminomutase [Thermodesulfobacteriota bacterium]